MDTSKLPKEQQHLRAGVRWPVTVLTPGGQIEAETENITPVGMLITCPEPPPTEGSFRVLVKVPNRQALTATAQTVWTTVTNLEEGDARIGTEIRFSSISKADHDFLKAVIARHYGEKIAPLSPEKPSGARVVGEQQAPLNRELQAGVQMPVFYNQHGKTVQASAKRISTKGCYVYSKVPLVVGDLFSLKIPNNRTGTPVKVDTSVVFRKQLASNKQWVMLLRFLNLTETDRQEIRQILEDAAFGTQSGKKSPYHKTTIGQAILRYFSRKRSTQNVH
ncbi:MAG: PilZ domain-containing protein [Syntrophobacteria bacterium]